MSDETTLHVFHDGECDWYVAESAEEAARLQREMTGLTVEDQADAPFVALPDGDPLTITADPYDKPDVRITKTCAEWAAANGAGFLASTEY